VKVRLICWQYLSDHNYKCIAHVPNNSFNSCLGKPIPATRRRVSSRNFAVVKRRNEGINEMFLVVLPYGVLHAINHYIDGMSYLIVLK